jgi:hypothetical protein
MSKWLAAESQKNDGLNWQGLHGSEAHDSSAGIRKKPGLGLGVVLDGVERFHVALDPALEPQAEQKSGETDDCTEGKHQLQAHFVADK